MADERIVLQYDPSDVIAQTGKANKAIESVEKTSDKSMASTAAAMDKHATAIVSISDRGQAAIDRMVDSAKRKEALATGSPAERLLVEKKIALSRVAGDQGAINQITLSYDRMVVAAQRADEAGKLQSAIKASHAAAKGAEEFAAALRRVQVESQKERESIEASITAIARRNAAIGRTPAQTLRLEASQAIAGLGKQATPDQVRRLSAEYEKLIKTHEAAANSGSKLAEVLSNPLQAAGSAVESIAAGLGKVGLIALGAAAGIAAAAKAGFDIVASQGRAAEAVTNFADTVGVSALEAYRLDIQAKLVGSSLEALTTGYKKLSLGIQEGSDEGKKSAAGLEKLGVRIFELNGAVRPFNELFGDIARKISAIAEPSARSAKAVELFGKSGQSLIPLLLQFDETAAAAKRASDGITDPLLRTLAETDDKIGELSASWEALKSRLAGKIVAVVEFAQRNGGFPSPFVGAGFSGQGNPNDDSIRAEAAAERQRRLSEGTRKILSDEGVARIKQFRDEQKGSEASLKAQLADATERRKAAEQFGPGAGLAEVEKRIATIKTLQAEEAGLTAQIKARAKAEQDAEAARKKATEDIKKMKEAAKDLVADGGGRFRVEAIEESIKKAQEERFKAELKIDNEIMDARVANQKAEISNQETSAEISRDKQLSELLSFHAATVEQKIAVEERKAEIERDYLVKTYAFKAQLLQIDSDAEISKAEQNADLIAAINEKYALAGRELTLKTDAALAGAGADAAAKSARLVEDQAQRNFDSVKRAADGLFDALTTRTKSWGDFLKNAVLLPALTLLKQVFSTFIAGTLTGQRGGGSGIGGLLGMLLGGGGIARAGAPGGTPGFAGPVAGLAGLGGGGGGFGGLAGLGGAGALGLAGASAGLFGAFRAGQSDNKFLKGSAPAIGALSGLVGFGALVNLFPALLAAGPAGWIAAGGIGATVGLIAAFRKTAETKIVEKVKSAYGITISKDFARNPLAGIIKDQFGGDIELGIRSPMIREMLSIYKMQSNQSGSGSGLGAIDNIPRGVSLSGYGGAAYQNPVSINGADYGYGGSLPGTGPSQPFDGRPIVIENRIQIDGRDVQASVLRTNQGSSGRRESAAVLSDPLLVFG